jgi:glycosyltransferase involved in cell wall biosynthesis
MKTSVLIIAHNEEKYIDKCINSIMRQTVKPDEIVLVVHNSTDRTQEIGEKYAINIVSFDGPKGIVYARIEGLRHVTGDIILCIDGDSEAQPNWVEVMTKTLRDDSNILVGSWVKFRGTFYGWINNLYNKTRCVRETEAVARWIWGPSFAFWGEDKDYVRDIFEQTIPLSQQLDLSRNPDDFWLALFMCRRGHLQVTNETFVTLNTKEHSNRLALERNLENIQNGNIMEEYFRANF